MKKAAAALVVFVLALCPLTVVGCGNGTWTNTGVSIRSSSINALAYDAKHDLLYAGTDSHGVLKYDGSKWTDTGGAVSSYKIGSLAYDSTQNILYAGISQHGVWQYKGTKWTETGGGILLLIF